MCDLPTEEFWVVLLNQAAKVIDRVRISTGGISGTVVDVRCVLREAIIHRAVCIAVCHNHPSGQIRPSVEDDRLTERISRAAKTMDIRLIDHIILTDGNYYSYADEGRLE
jgi:DNA repair protein RadC